MSHLLRKYKVVSLGSRCFCKLYIEKYIESAAHQIFDFTGTSAWSILELLKNDFDGLLLKENIQKMTIFNEGRVEDKEMYTNVKYYVRFKHNNFDDDHIKETTESMVRKIDRFRNIMKENDYVIFLRLEEDQKNRIKYDQYDEMNKKSEHEYIIELSKWMKLNSYPKFKIIFFTNNTTNYDKENNIISIHANIDTILRYNIHHNLDLLFCNNKDWLKECLNDDV